MRVYVRSRGHDQHRGYRWHEVAGEGETELPFAPPVYGQMGLADLAGSPAVVLGRHRGNVVLLITGLPSQRKDFYPRTIANSVLWIGELEEEGRLRRCCSRALRNLEEFGRVVDTALSSDEEAGFQASDATFVSLVEESAPAGAAFPRRRHIRAFSTEALLSTAEMVEACALPNADGPLLAFNPAWTVARMIDAGIRQGVAGSFDEKAFAGGRDQPVHNWLASLLWLQRVFGRRTK